MWHRLLFTLPTFVHQLQKNGFLYGTNYPPTWAIARYLRRMPWGRAQSHSTFDKTQWGSSKRIFFYYNIIIYHRPRFVKFCFDGELNKKIGKILSKVTIFRFFYLIFWQFVIKLLRQKEKSGFPIPYLQKCQSIFCWG